MKAALVALVASVILALGIAAGGFLAGGRYQFEAVDGGIAVYDRFAGSAHVCHQVNREMGWTTIPTTS